MRGFRMSGVSRGFFAMPGSSSIRRTRGCGGGLVEAAARGHRRMRIRLCMAGALTRGRPRSRSHFFALSNRTVKIAMEAVTQVSCTSGSLWAGHPMAFTNHAVRGRKDEELMQTISVRLLAPDNVGDYRKIRLAALKSAPQSFGGSYEEEASLPICAFEERLRDASVFGGYIDGEISGIAGFSRGIGKKREHKGTLWESSSPLARASAASARHFWTPQSNTGPRWLSRSH